jgi:hypothetical protein
MTTASDVICIATGYNSLARPRIAGAADRRRVASRRIATRAVLRVQLDPRDRSMLSR